MDHTMVGDLVALSDRDNIETNVPWTHWPEVRAPRLGAADACTTFDDSCTAFDADSGGAAQELVLAGAWVAPEAPAGASRPPSREAIQVHPPARPLAGTRRVRLVRGEGRGVSD